MQSIDKLLNSIRRYLNTWQMLLLHPDRFVRMTLQKRAEDYVPPVAFLFVSLVVLNYVLTLIGYFVWRAVDPDAPVNPRIWTSPSQFIVLPSLIQITVQAFLWYAVFHKWLGHTMTVMTTTPYKRIFKELVYIEAPLAAIGIAVFILGYWLFQFVLSGSLLVLIKLVPDVYVSDDVLSNVLFILFCVAMLVLLIGLLLAPGWLLITFYDTVVATTLFNIPRRRAIQLCLPIAIISTLPIGLYNVWESFITPGQLSDAETAAAREVRAICVAEREYYQKKITILSLSDLQKYYASPPQVDVWKILHPSELARLEKLSNDTFGGYRFHVQRGRHGGYVHAVPVTYEGESKYSFVGNVAVVDATDLIDSRITAGDHDGGQAFSDDKRLIFLSGE